MNIYIGTPNSIIIVIIVVIWGAATLYFFEELGSLMCVRGGRVRSEWILKGTQTPHELWWRESRTGFFNTTSKISSILREKASDRRSSNESVPLSLTFSEEGPSPLQHIWHPLWLWSRSCALPRQRPANEHGEGGLTVSVQYGISQRSNFCVPKFHTGVAETLSDFVRSVWSPQALSEQSRSLLLCLSPVSPSPW